MANNNSRKSFVSKQVRKSAAGQCQICGEPNYDLLDVHRITPGHEGGRYTIQNTVVLCCTCHRLHHAGTIDIQGWFFSTAGWTLLIKDENGEEQFIFY